MPSDQDLAALGQVIRRARQERDISVGQLAATVGIPPGQVKALEAGRINPGYRLLFNLANGLGIRPTEILIRWEERMARP
jgi:transcriptional regulator with XRE-family HTH domain